MGILDRIRRGVENAVGNSVERGVSNAVEKTVAPKVEQAADNLAAKATANISGMDNQTSGEAPGAPGGALGGLFSQMAGAAQGFANEAAKNMKICTACGEGAAADKKFCPSCGAKLPDQTIAEGAVCKACGKQNDIGIKFCSGCGVKLPQAEAEEADAKAKDEAVLNEWDKLLPEYPRWSFGGYDFQIEHGGNDEYGKPYYFFTARGTNTDALYAYRNLLKQHGFIPAGQNPSDDMLYKMVNGECRCFESCEPFCADPGHLSVSFGIREPKGGFDYKKPEKKEGKGFFALFKK